LLQLLLFLPPIKASSLLLLLPSPNPSGKPRNPRFRKQLPTKHPEGLDLSFQELLPGNSWPLENLEDDNNDDDHDEHVAMEGRCGSIAGTQTLFCKTDIVYGRNIRSSPSGAQYVTLQKYFSHGSLAIYFLATPLIKLKLGLQIGARLLR
jgi:hypothetical protein